MPPTLHPYMSWSVYIIQCNDSKLYTGITTSLQRRIKDHNSGNGCRFTKYRTPVKLLHHEDGLTKPEALKREAAIKKLTRKEKIELIKGAVPEGDCPFLVLSQRSAPCLHAPLKLSPSHPLNKLFECFRYKIYDK